MRSRWSSQHAGGQHAPVEMRFVDMFMTALGSLIFIALLLVFLLPKAAQTNPSTLPEPGAPLQERDTDKHVVKRWIGILLLTKGCEADDLLLYVRWDGSVMNFETRAPTGKMPEFDAGDLKHGSLVGHRTFRIGGTYDALASFPYLNVASDLLNGEQVRTMLHYGVSNASGAWDVYVALKNPRALAGKECVVHPTILSSDRSFTGEKIVLSLPQPYAWLRHLRIEKLGSVITPEPKGDDAFLRRLGAFSDQQSRLLCEKKSICDTQDAHWAALKPKSSPPQATSFNWLTKTAFSAFGYAKSYNMTQAECEKACLDDPKCVAVEWRDHPRFCDLHDRLTTLGPGTLSVGMKTAARSPIEWRPDHVAIGGTAPSKKDGLSRDECAKACADDPKCQAVEFVKPARVCNIFASVPGIAPSPLGANAPTDAGLKTQVKLGKPDPTQAFVLHDNYDVVGGDLRRMERVDQDTCKDACMQEAECKGYSYDKWNRWCFLKNALPLLRLEPNTVSALRAGMQKPEHSSAPVRMHKYTNRAFPWRGQQANKAESFDECQSRCQAAESCIAATYFKATRQCRLMETAEEPVPDSKADSTVKRQETKS